MSGKCERRMRERFWILPPLGRSPPQEVLPAAFFCGAAFCTKLFVLAKEVVVGEVLVVLPLPLLHGVSQRHIAVIGHVY